MKKCLGCGIIMQETNKDEPGYTENITGDFCTRCFRIKNYNEYTKVKLNADLPHNIISDIDKRRSLILLVIDLLCIPNNLDQILSLLKNSNVVLVLNKYDLLEHVTYEEKIKRYFNSLADIYSDIICVSTKNNYNLDRLYNIIKNYNNKNIYLIGNTNAGKSSLINKLLELYSKKESILTISPIASTTLDKVEVPFEDHILIDTPGLLDSDNITDYIDFKMLKKINPKKSLKPITYRLKNEEYLLVEDFLGISSSDRLQNSITFYVSNNLNIKKIFSNNNPILSSDNLRNYKIKANEDIVIEGLGFIKIKNKGNISIYFDKRINITIRPSFI